MSERNKRMSEYCQAIWNALPGTTKELHKKTGVPVGSIRKWLRRWQDDGSVRSYARHFNSISYTRVYTKTTGS